MRFSGNTNEDFGVQVTYEPGELPDQTFPPFRDWPRFQKQVPTRAVRIEGPFTVDTSEGPLTCADGYLCVDARGYPYPVAADEFDLIYGPAARPTIVALIRQAQERLEGERGQKRAAMAEERAAGVRGDGGDDGLREMSLAITALQEAVMWTQRAMARKHGMFNEIDVEAIALQIVEDERIVKT